MKERTTICSRCEVCSPESDGRALAGVDFREDQRLADRLHAALQAPSLTALPDFTYPRARTRALGVSLAQPGYLELWEIGLGEDSGKRDDLPRLVNSALHKRPKRHRSN